MKPLLISLALFISLPAFAQSERADALYRQIRCVVCEAQSIAESHTPLAQDMRHMVDSQIEAGRSDAEILQYFAERYGDDVLFNPPMQQNTLVLWVGPAALLALGLALVLWNNRRSNA